MTPTVCGGGEGVESPLVSGLVSWSPHCGKNCFLLVVCYLTALCLLLSGSDVQPVTSPRRFVVL